MEIYHQKAYHNQQSTHPLQTNHRYDIQRSDLSRLYTRHNKSLGIDVKKRPENNVNNWMNEDSRDFHADIAASVFHYRPRAARTERFEFYISTPDMEKAAWTYVHNSQLILDGTFGVASSRLLLWIAMGIDSQGKGLPVAFFLFSAPAGSIATHAGYNTEIITHLLMTWKHWLSSRALAKNRIFEPTVVITDTDVKERGALTATWPSIHLLLCKFHLRQCWTNKRSVMLRKKETYSGASIILRIRKLESSCVRSFFSV
jgi:hypothetical protein